MISWPTPAVPAIPGEPVPLHLYDTSSGEVFEVDPEGTAEIYVCGITPYDATHLGHAATYVTFDLAVRALLDNGHDVHYVQNSTDVDDPLLERAARDGVDWRELARDQLSLYREDMTALGVIPPRDFVGVVESVEPIGAAVARLLETGAAYRVPNDDAPGSDVYFDLTCAPHFGAVSHDDRDVMTELSATRGGDPERAGKRDPLDPLLWRAERPGEPSWDVAGLGPGRPGWHIECTVIALERLAMPFDIQGGGSDLVFPHHEMSAAQAEAITGDQRYATHYCHQAMVGYQGEKMSKSKGNLVLVSALRRAGHDPMAIRLVLLDHHYRTDWEYTDDLLALAEARLARWREALSVNAAPPAADVLAEIRAGLADDLDAARALRAVDAWAERTLTEGGDDPAAPGHVARALDALLGVRV